MSVAVPRYRLFLSNSKNQTVGGPVCESEHLNDLRVFPRKVGQRYVLYEHKNKIQPTNLDIEIFSDVVSGTEAKGGSGWHCKNGKCSALLMVAPGKLPTDESLLRISCPLCDHPAIYKTCDHHWIKPK